MFQWGRGTKTYDVLIAYGTKNNSYAISNLVLYTTIMLTGKYFNFRVAGLNE